MAALFGLADDEHREVGARERLAHHEEAALAREGHELAAAVDFGRHKHQAGGRNRSRGVLSEAIERAGSAGVDVLRFGCVGVLRARLPALERADHDEPLLGHHGERPGRGDDPIGVGFAGHEPLFVELRDPAPHDTAARIAASTLSTRYCSSPVTR